MGNSSPTAAELTDSFGTEPEPTLGVDAVRDQAGVGRAVYT